MGLWSFFFQSCVFWVQCRFGQMFVSPYFSAIYHFGGMSFQSDVFRPDVHFLIFLSVICLSIICPFDHLSFGHLFYHPYAHTARQPLLSNANLNKLQTTKNAAQRTATSCTKTALTDHIHQETKVLKIHDHMDMRGRHAYTSFTEPQHPLHYLTHKNPINWNKRKTSALYNTLLPVPVTHYEHISTPISPVEAYTPWNQTLY